MPRNQHPIAGLAVVAGLALVLAACVGGGGAASPSPSETPPAGLDGRTFLSTGITGGVLAAGSQVRLTFGSGTLGASAGCNIMSGSYRVEDGFLRTDQMGMTEMACAEPLMAQDQWISGFLPGAAIHLDGDTLTLAKNGVTLTLTDSRIANPDRPLLGTRWVVESLVSGDAVSSVPIGVRASLVFGERRVDAETGCNRGGGTIAVTGGSISFGPVALTKMACEPPAMSLERAVTAVLGGTVTWAIEADTLMLTGAGGGLVLRAMP